MANSDSSPLTLDQCVVHLRAMVKAIGGEPQQDPHFDYWHYAGQHALWGSEQRYSQAVIRKYLDQLCGTDSAALDALGGPMDLFMAACRRAGI